MGKTYVGCSLSCDVKGGNTKPVYYSREIKLSVVFLLMELMWNTSTTVEQIELQNKMEFHYFTSNSKASHSRCGSEYTERVCLS